MKCKYLHMQEGIVDRDNKIKIAICDDQEKEADNSKRTIQKVLRQMGIEGDLKVYMRARDFLGSQVGYDVVFLDIEMPDMDGLRIAEELKAKKAGGKVVFMTNHSQYIQEAYKVQPFRYLYKGDPEQWIQDALADILKENEGRQGILLESDGRCFHILLDKILYIEALGDDVAFVLGGQEKYIVRMALKRAEELLGSRFVSCRRETLVNLKRIFKIEEGSVKLDDGTEIPISYRKRREVKQRYVEYIKRVSGW